MKVVFVGGVHGSGKSRLCAALAPEIRATHQIASQLLRSVTDRSNARDERTGDKAVSDVRGNQEIILRGIEQLRSHTDRLLLDGHFCLLTTDEVRAIPVEYFRALTPIAMLLVEVAQAEIQSRLERRDQEAYPEDRLAVLLQCERMHAQVVSKQLSVPLKVLSEPDSLRPAIDFLAPLLRC